jgi:hypothetical protein
MTHSRGHAAPGIKQKAISVWLIPTKYVYCESERWQQKKNKWLVERPGLICFDTFALFYTV